MNEGDKEHIRECWKFCYDLAKELVDDEKLQLKLSFEIFKKSFCPSHIFQPGRESTPPAAVPPSEKQLQYAKDLNIENPEQYTKQELSQEIKKVLDGSTRKKRGLDENKGDD